MTKSTLAKESGIPYTTLDSMLKRETDSARLATVFRIAKVLNTTVEELVFDGSESGAVSAEERRVLELYALLDDRGKNTVLSLLEKEADNSRALEEKGDLCTFRVFDAPAAAGEALPVLTESATEMVCRESEIPTGASFGIRISGDSMEPLLQDGDLVYVEHCTGLAVGEIGIFLLNGESLCKKLGSDGTKTRLLSLNPKYPPIDILESDHLKLVGKVILR